MTPEQIAEKLIDNHYTIHDSYVELSDILIEAIATALRQAREDALEEAAVQCDDWIQAGGAAIGYAKTFASEIRALKHKDQK